MYKYIFFFIFLLFSFLKMQAQCDTSTVQGSFPVNFTFNPNSAICPGNTVSFNGSPSGNQYVYSWNFGDPASGAANTATTQNASHAFSYSASAQSYTVTFVVIDTVGEDTCNFRTHTVNVQSGQFVLVDTIDFNICVPGLNPVTQNDTLFTFNILNPASGNFIWDFGDGTPLVGPSPALSQSHLFTNFGTYLITVTEAGSTCPGFQHVFQFYTNPIASMALLSNPFVCEGDTIFTFNNSTPGTSDYFVWNWGDGTTTTVNDTSQQSHLYQLSPAQLCGPNPGNGGAFQYSITLEAYNACFLPHTNTSPINIKPKAHAEFTFPSIVCVNQPVPFTNQTCPAWGGNVYSWNFGDPASGAANTSNATNPTHTYATPGIYTVTLIANKTNGCSEKDTIQHTVIVTDDPVINISLTNNNNGCAPYIVTFDNNSTPSVGVNYFWSISPTLGVSYVNGTNSNSLEPQIQFSVPGIYTVSLFANNLCNSASYSTTITVKGPPVVNLNLQNDICIPVGASAQINPSASISSNFGTISGINWTFNNGTPATANTANPGTISFLPGTHSINLSVTNECGTVTGGDIFVVREIPQANVSYTLSDSLGCLNGGQLVANFTNSSLPLSGVSYNWSVSPGFGWSYTSGNSGSYSPQITFNTVGNYTVSFTISNACSSDTWTTVISVKDDPIVTLTAQPDICLNPGQSSINLNPFASFNANNGTITQYNWSFFNGVPNFATTPNPGLINFGPGTHTQIIAASNVCGTTTASDVFLVRLFPDANISFTGNGIPGNDTVCIPLNTNFLVAFSNASTPGTSVTHNWSVSPATGFNFASGSATSSAPSINFTQPGTYTVNYTIGNICGQDNQSFVFVIQQPPSVTVNAVPDSCGFLVVNPTAVLNGNNATVLSYSWTYAGANQSGSTLQSPLPVTFLPGNDTIFLTIITSCGATSDFETFFINPPAVLSTRPDTSICNNTGPIGLWGTPPGGTWSGANVTQGATNAVATLGTFTPSGAGVFNAVYSYGAGNCLVRDTAVITVNNPPVVSAGADIAVCQGSGTVVLTGNPSGGYWTNAGNAVVTGFVPVTPGTYNFTYHFTSLVTGCTSRDSMSITVNPLPIVTVPDTSIYCFTLIPITLPAGNPPGGFWTGANVTGGNTYNSAASGLGFHGLQYHVTNGFGCIDSAEMIANVVPPVPADAGADFQICVNAATIQLTGLPNGGSWLPQPGLTANGDFNPTQTTVGIHNLVYTFGSGDCQTWDTVAVNVLALPVLNPGAGFDACISDITFTLGGATPSGGFWYGTSITDSVTFLPSTVGLGITPVFYVYTDGNGCSDTATTDITVNPLPNPNFVVQTLGCINSLVGFTNFSSGAATYSWDFGDGNTSTIMSPTHVYTDTGTYVVSMIAYGPTAAACPDTMSVTVTIVDIPVPSFAAVPDSGCASFLSNGSVGLNVDFIDSSLTYGGTYSWSFGNGQVSTISNPGTITFLEGQNDTTYYVQLFLTNLCGTGIYMDTVDVSALPKSIFGTNVSSGCSPAPFSFSNISQGNATSFFWNYGNGITSTLPNPTTQYFTTGANDTTYTITLIASNACGADTSSTTILVHPNNVDAFFNATPTSGCAPLTINVSNFSNGTVVSYDFGDGSVSAAANAIHTYTLPGTYILTQFANNGCSYDTLGVPITVYPAPAVSFVVQNPICEGMAANFTNTTNNVSGILWDFGVTNILSDTSNANNPVYFYPAPGSYNVTLTAYSSISQCVSSESQTVIVHPAPVIDFTLQDTSGCTPFNLAVTSNNSQGAFHFWDFGNGQSSGAATPSVSYVTAGSYTVNYTNTTGFGCESDTSFTVLALDQPVSSFIPSATSVCGAPATISFTNTSTGNSLSYSWFFGNGQSSIAFEPQVTYTVADTFTVSLVTFNGLSCSDTSTAQIIVHPQPVANASVTPLQGCSPLNVNFNNLSTNANLYSWDFGDGSPVANTLNTNHTYLINGIYNIALISNYSNVCADTFQTQVQVFPSPVSDFTFTTTGNVCNGPVTVSMINNSQNAQNYLWDLGGNFYNTFEPVQTFNAVGTYTLTLVASNGAGCADTISHTVTIHPQPVAGMTVSPLQGCTPLTVNANNTSVGGTFYTWSFGDGTPPVSGNAPPAHTYLNDSVYTVTLIANYQNVCFDTVQTNVTVSPLPVADFTMNFNGNLCGGPVTLTTVNNSQYASDYLWFTGNGNQFNTPTMTQLYTAQDTFLVTLIASNGVGCSDTSVQSFILHPQPVAAATVSPLVGCPPLVVSATNNSTGYTSVTWNFGDGTPVQGTVNPLPHTYFQPDTNFVISMIANYQNVCFDTFQTTVSISPQPIADFTLNLSGDVCGGPLTVTPTNLSQNATVYQWNYGNGNTSSLFEPVISYSTPDTFNITLTATNSAGCISTMTQPVILHPQPNAQANFSIPENCPPFNAVITNQSTNFTSLTWNFGDGTAIETTYQPQPHTYYVPDTTYTITLLLNYENVCFDTLTQTVLSGFPPVADFVPTVSGDVCGGPATLSMTNTSLNASSYFWNFGDGQQFSFDENPVVTYQNPGVFVVALEASNQFCKDTAYYTFTLDEQVTADLVADTATGCSPLLVHFGQNASNANSYLWHFGDGDTSSLPNPLHYYQNPGIYDVSLIAYIAGTTCIDTVFYNDLITVTQGPVASFEYLQQDLDPYNNVIQFTNGSNFSTNYVWSFGDGNTSTDTNPLHTYNTNDSMQVVLYAYNELGCVDTAMGVVSLTPFGDLQIPNAFAPFSGVPGANLFQPKGIGLVEYEIAVYTTWGERVWESTKIDEKGIPVEAWDGKDKNGQYINSTVFVWKVHKAKFYGNREWGGMKYNREKESPERIGTLTLLK